MDESSKLWIALVLGLAAAIVVVWTAPDLAYVPKGIVLPTKQVRAPTSPQQINFFSQAPLDYQSLGVIRVVQHMSKPSTAAERQVMDYARKLAAKVGANGVIIKQFFRTRPGTGPEGLASYNFTGEAIYVSNTLGAAL